jgi:hypothetical protein
MTQTDAQALQESSRPLWGASVWQVRLNIQHHFQSGYAGAFLDEFWIDFREPLAVPEKHTKYRRVGSLWVNDSASGTRLSHSREVLVASSDAAAKVLEEFSKMVGFRLLRTEVQAPGGDTCFVFDNDFVLTCFPAKRSGLAWEIRST